MIEHPVLQHRIGGEPGLEELAMTLRELVGSRARLVTAFKLDRGVYRILLATPSRMLSLVAKRLAAPVAYRNQLALECWLPAVGLAHVAPALMGVAAEREGRTVWHLYEDLGDATVEDALAAPDVVEAAVRLVATIHARFAQNPVLPECRLWGEDHGIAFYDSSVRDAISAVSAVVARSGKRTRCAAAERLLARLERLAEERDERARALAEFGGSDTLLHGDLWLENMRADAETQRVRLIDWDHVGPGSFSYDLSTLAFRVPAEHRAGALDLYRRAAAEQGMRLPADSELTALFTTAECARLANIAIWPALVATEDGSRWAFDELAAIEEWLERVQGRCAA